MSDKRKIVYCLPSLYISGGMERVLAIKANYFADVLDYDVYIILTDQKGKEPYYPISPKITLIDLGVDFEELWDKPLRKKILIYLKKQRKYKQLLKKELHKIKPDITISMLRREVNFITKIKDGSIKIGEIHVNKENFREVSEGENVSFFSRLLSWFWMCQLKRKLKKLSRFIVLTHGDSAKWKLKNKIVIPNPLSSFPDTQASLNKKEVIAVGRYAWQKGFDLLIDCWKIVNEKHPDWKLRIYGEGEREKLQQQIDRLQLNDSCILEYAVTNILEKYQESSVFVLSSRNEGFGLVLIEAMACGLPPVSFDCPSGPSDIIEDSVSGYLVENGNIDQLAERIIYLIENEDIRKETGRQARKQVDKYKMEHIAQQWVALFESLTKENHVRDEVV